MISVVGKKPIVKILLNNVECDCLWDTGSMISLISKNVLAEKFPKTKMHSVDEFMGTGLKLAAANQTELKILGIVLFDFGVGKTEVVCQIPFIVTEDVEEIIIGYNVIENLIVNGGEEFDPHEFLSKMSNVSRSKIEGVVSRVCASFGKPGVIGEVKVLKDQIVPANCVYRVKCQTEVKSVRPNETVLFAPKDVEIDGVNVMETPETLKVGRKQNLFISVHNISAKSVILKKGTQIGDVCEISQVIPIPEPSFVKAEGESELGDEIENEPHKIDLEHLTCEQKQEVQELLEEYADVFSKGKNDIGRIKDLKMQIDLMDKTPVGEPYRKIPKLLYEDVKNHINCLLANGWIKKSCSPYSSPLVCVRKKDGGFTALCGLSQVELEDHTRKSTDPKSAGYP